MSTNPSYTFVLNVSRKAYPYKIPSDQVGSITFTTQTLTLDELENKVREGFAFCYIFKNKSKILSMSEKTIAGFQSTSVVFFDFDHMTVPMREFIQGLDYKPTIAYTSYSNDPAMNDCRYRLIYAFSDPIDTVSLFNKVYSGIACSNGFEKTLDKRSVNQYYNGSNATCDIYNDEYPIYALDDFDKYYPSDTFPFENKEEEDVIHLSSQMENPPELSDEFMADLKLMDRASFLDKYMPLYESDYVRSLSTELIMKEDKTCYLYPPDYLEVFRTHAWYKESKYKKVRLQDGRGRRRKLYIAAKIMIHNLPDISLDQLVYNLIRERDDYYFNNDGQLSDSVLIDIAKNAFRYRSIPIKSRNKKKYRVNKEYWAVKGVKPNAAKNVIKKHIHEEEVLAVYDFSKSVKQNLEILASLGIKAGKSYLYALVKRYPNGNATDKDQK